MTLLFAVRDLVWKHPGSDLPSLNRLTCDIQKGVVTAIKGRSGSGKTTFLQVLAGFWEEKPDSGSILFRDPGNGVDCLYEKLSRRVRAEIRAQFGYILQNHTVFPHLPAWMNISLPLLWAGWGEAVCRQRSLILCQLVDQYIGAGDADTLTNKMDRSAGELSTGQKQRIGILRAIASDPLVVFADEPTSNLDCDTANAAFLLLQLWKNGQIEGVSDPSRGHRSLLIINHNLNQMVGNEILRVDQWLHFEGGTVREGNPPEIIP